MKKKMFAVLMTAVMLLGLGGMQPSREAQAAVTHSNLTIGEGYGSEVVLVPGETVTLDVPVKAVKDYIFNPKFYVELPENAPFEVSDVECYRMWNGTVSTLKDISQNENSYLRFAITTKETAKIGTYKFDLVYEDYSWDGELITEETSGYGQRITLAGIVAEEKLPAELAISNLRVTGELKPGGTANIIFTVTNTGEIEAKNVRLAADYSGGLLIPEYTDYTKKLGDMEQKDAQKVTLKVKVLEHVTQKMVTLPIQISYKDSEGTEYTADANNMLYLEIEIPEEKEETFENGTLLVNNVRQSPASPKAGEKVSLTFDMENTGEKDFTEVKLYLTYVPNTGFEPVNAEPYQYVGTVKAGEKKTVTVQVIAGNEIPAGMNTLGVDYTYVDGKEEKNSESVDLYVLNVQEKETLGNSKPKLMVSEFSTSIEPVKSGEEFDFTFQVYNTHSETTAKNIKVTVTSEMFSVTKGSNSFFLQGIEPGESEEILINLKASAAATTGSYPVSIQMEYEYDGMPTTESNTDGVVVTETKMLLIKENLRVSVENVSIGSWEMPSMGVATPLSFSIYNMGKSTLNNVYFTVSGDFEVANGSSYYYGSLQAGYPDYVEMDVIPLAEGEITGMLVIHMEDSNGDEVTYEKEIDTYVAETSSVEDPDMNMEWDNTEGDVPTDAYPLEEESVMPIVSLPVYIGVLVAVFLVALLTTRGIRLAVYKKKLRDAEE